MADKPNPVEVFGVRSDGELIPLRPGSPPGDGAPSGGDNQPADGERTWILGPLSDATDHAGRRSGPPLRHGPKTVRPGGTGDRPTRGGGREDVVAPVHVLPGPASRALHSGDLFDDPLPGVTVDVRSLEVGANGSSWNATVTCGLLRRRARPATLRAYPSPSANLTVLELVPRRSTLLHTRSFIRTGVPAIAALGSRINRAAGNRPGNRPAAPVVPAQRPVTLDGDR